MRYLVATLFLMLALPQVLSAQCGCGDQCGCGPGCRCGHSGSNGFTPPEYGVNDGFTGKGITLRSRLSLADMGSPSGALGSAIWGWADTTDPRGTREYALYGLADRTAFVDVTNPDLPVFVGHLPTATGSSAWRELKTYQNYAFIVSDGNGNHGMQVFDLTRLRNYAGTPITFSADTRYFQGNQPGAISNAHTIFINEETGFGYVFGTSTHGGGAHVVDLRNPLAPTFAAGYAASGYIHDGQVVQYSGPDAAYQGREILFAANSRGTGDVNDDFVQILDVTNKSAITLVGQATHPNARYIHQGWLTPDQRYFLVNDELDEFYSRAKTTTHVYDVSDLANPVYKGGWLHPNDSFVIDHNLFIREYPGVGVFAFSSNYTMGLRVIKIGDLDAAGGPNMEEIAWFDTYPADDGERNFNGQWGSYPFFNSGTIIAGDRQNGLFVLTVHAVPEPGTMTLVGLGAATGLARFRRIWRGRKATRPIDAALVARRSTRGARGSLVKIRQRLPRR